MKNYTKLFLIFQFFTPSINRIFIITCCHRFLFSLRHHHSCVNYVFHPKNILMPFFVFITVRFIFIAIFFAYNFLILSYHGDMKGIPVEYIHIHVRHFNWEVSTQPLAYCRAIFYGFYAFAERDIEIEYIRKLST
jgi:hypothetical protein